MSKLVSNVTRPIMRTGLAVTLLAATALATSANVVETFGEKTRAGHGGVLVTGTSIESGNEAGHFQLVDGFVEVSAAGVGNLVAPYKLVTDTGQTIDIVSIEPGVYSVRNGSEFEALDGQSDANLAGATVKIRQSQNVEADWSGTRFRFKQLTPSLTVTGHKPQTSVWNMQFTECSGITIDGLAFVGEWKSAGDESAYLLKFSGNNAGSWNENILIQNCSLNSSRRDPTSDDAWKSVRGILVTNNNNGNQRNVRILDNVIQDAYVGISVPGGTDIKILRNYLDRIFADRITTSADQEQWDCEVSDNFVAEALAEAGRDYSANGGPNDVHGGNIEFNCGGLAGDVRGIKAFRNVVCDTHAHYQGNSLSIKDLPSPHLAHDVEIAGNVFQQRNGGIRLERCDGARVHHNGIYTNLNEIGSVNLILSDCQNCNVERNISPNFSNTGAASGTNTLTNNHMLAETVSEYNSLFSGDFTGPTMPPRTKAATLTAYAPEVGGSLDPGDSSERIGPIWFDDYDNQSSNYPTADYVVTNDAEWNALMAQSTASLEGKIIELSGSNFTQLQITGHDFAVAPTFRSADSSSKPPSIRFNGVGKMIFDGLIVQMTGWPKDYTSCIYNNGAAGDTIFRKCTFRHGYGPSQVDIDTSAEYPEYERVDNVQTATTTSAAYALTWKDATCENGWIEFFNNGSETVYVAHGGSGVTATSGDQAVAPGAKYRFTAVDATTSTHFAILAATGTTEVNARTEVGLAYYLADAFASSGVGSFTNLRFEDCLFEGLGNAIKASFSISGKAVAIRNKMRAIYQDTISAFHGEESTWIALNDIQPPFARSGIAQNLNGDARDPHGDYLQFFDEANPHTIDNVYLFWNYTTYTPLRDGAYGAQAEFFNDNNVYPSYERVFSIGNIWAQCATNGLTYGEVPPYEPRNIYAWGSIVANYADPTKHTNAGGPVRAGDLVLLEDCFFTVLRQYGETLPVLKNSGPVGEITTLTGHFPLVGGYPAAKEREEVWDVFTSAGGLIPGIGIDAVRAAFVPGATEPEDMVDWTKLPSGVAWSDVDGVALNTVHEFPLRLVANHAPNQAVIPGAGVEWRAVDADKVTELQAWTSASGTVQPNQYIQIRKLSANVGRGQVTASININGFDTSVVMTTILVLQNAFDPNGAYWWDTENMPANTTVMEWETAIKFPDTFPSQQYPFWAVGNMKLVVAAGLGRIILEIEDAAETVQLYYDSVDVAPPKDKAIIFNLKVDFDNLRAIVSIDGNEVINQPIPDSPGNNHFQTNRKAGFGGNSVQILPGSEIEYLKLWFTTGGTRTLRKEISVAALGSVAAINADPWTLGGAAVAV